MKILCPDPFCEQRAFTGLGAYAEHRFDAHQVLAQDAVREWDAAARLTQAVAKAPDAPEGANAPTKESRMTTTPPMSQRTCSHCQKKGHRRDHCPDKDKPTANPLGSICHYCHRADGTHSPKCRRRPEARQGASAKPGRPARRGRPASAPSTPGAILPGLREARATCEAWAAQWARAAKSLRDLEAMAAGQLPELPRTA